MIPWIIVLFCLYVGYYTFSYAKVLWRDDQRFAASVIVVLALSIVTLPLYLLFR
ncbi:hypothetical protein [Anaerobacillus alkaliphilus]|uniref:hypothetical protein n=1 Tax=Anaerobacillus alkaliphilus TaxID=1548597 RepID=UPI001375BACA|nr:hypothetical protein [Anaerobacillus alkaliphilus]